MKQELKRNLAMMTSKIAEVSLDQESFRAARQRGVRSWIIKHILYKKNKVYITVFIALSIISIYFRELIQCLA